MATSGSENARNGARDWRVNGPGGKTKMNWRNAMLSGVLAAGLMLTFVPRAAADPPPWAGRWHHKHHDGRYGRDDDDWRSRRWQRYDHDRGYGDRYYRGRSEGGYGRYGAPYYGGYRYDRRGNGDYGKLTDRMRNDQAKIDEIG